MEVSDKVKDVENEVVALLEDLRFYIGTFFLIVGIVLAIEGFRHPHPEEPLNLIAGFSFMVFSLFGLVSSLVSHWRHAKKR